MRIAIGSDRRGYIAKDRLIKHLKGKGYEILDVGPYDAILPVDYPIYGEKVGKAVIHNQADYGIVICATGNGILMAANKVKGIRCGMGYSDEVARLMREHNNANVICFGQDYMDYKDIEKRTDIFLNAAFAAGYHCQRVQQLSDIENGIDIQQSEFVDPRYRKKEENKHVVGKD